MTDAQNKQLTDFINEALDTSYEAFDGFNIRKSTIKCMESYGDLFKSSKTIVEITTAIKTMNKIPLNDSQLYLKEKEALNNIVPQMLAFNEAQEQIIQKCKANINNQGVTDQLEMATELRDIVSTFVYELARPTIEHTASYKETDYIPCLTHYPTYTDARSTHAGAPLFLAVANVARLYGSYIYKSFLYIDKDNESVKLWKKDGNNYEPINIPVNKVDIFNNELAGNLNAAIWPMLYDHALKNSGFDINKNSIGQIIETIFGEDFKYMNYSQLLLDAKDDDDLREYLFYSLKRWIENGFPTAMKLSYTGKYPQGWYNVLGVYENHNDGTRFLRINNLDRTFDIDYYRYLADFAALDVNMSDKIAGVLQVQRPGVDIITEDEKEAFLWHHVSNKMKESYLSVAKGIYFALLVTIKSANIVEPGIFALNVLAGNFTGVLLRATGCHDSIIENYLKPLSEASQMIEKTLPKNKDSLSKVRIDICRAFEYFYEIFEYKDARRFDPEKEFIYSFATNVSESWFRLRKKTVDPEAIEFKAEELMDTPEFIKYAKSITSVTQIFPSKKHIEAAMAACKLI